MSRLARSPAWRILVAGGGVPSLAFALAIRRAAGEAAAITVSDPRSSAARAPDPRAYALSPAAVRMLSGLGLWKALRDHAQPIAGMTITDSRVADPVRPRYLTFDEDGESLGFMIESGSIADALSAACRAEGVVLDGQAVAGIEPAETEIAAVGRDGDRRSASLLVAADGARSRLRESAGIGWVGRAYGQSGIVATVAHERDHGGQAVQHFLPNGPFAILPLAGPGRALQYRSSIVWTDAAAEATRVLALEPEVARTEVEARFGLALGRIAIETDIRAFPLSVGLARRFVGPRMALLGDAAHEIHPLAGQGLNLGLGDAAALAERVVDAIRLGLDPGAAAVLAAYERDRRFDAVALAGVTHGLNRLFSNDVTPVRAIRDLGLGLVDRASSLKRLAAREASGLTRRAPRLMRGEAL